MGGDYYGGRDVGTDTDSAQVGGSGFHPSLNPIRWKDENLQSEALHPIIFALDITGSMGDWVKIVYNKMPMFYGQIMMQKYLSDPAISFCAVDDVKVCDPSKVLQITEFGQGIAIDQLLGKMCIDGNGGGNAHESYDMAAYFYANEVDLVNCEIPFFFLTGDEAYWETENPKEIQEVFGHGIKSNEINSRDNWKLLMTKYNVFMVKKEYDNYSNTQWHETLGEERVFHISTPKACVDVMLGAIALTSGAKDLNGYIEDMKIRGQSEERIKEVSSVLKKYAEKVASGQIQVIRNVVNLEIPKPQVLEVPPSNNNVSDSDLTQIVQLVDKFMLEEFDEETKLYRQKLNTLQKEKSGDIPKEFICPITKNIMIDPAMTSDGHTFERLAIENWMMLKNFSPVTGVTFEHNALLPNIAVKQLIKDFSDSK